MTKAAICLLSAALLASCAGGAKESPASPMSQKMASRLTKPDMSRRSVYDRAMQASFGKKADTGNWLGHQKVHTNSYADTRSFGRTRSFHTGTYARADAKNRMASEMFSQANKASRDSKSTFATRESRFSGQTAREGGQSFHGSDQVYRTTANRDALKSQEKNTGPQFIQLEEQSKDPAYSEEQVRKLLGRD